MNKPILHTFLISLCLFFLFIFASYARPQEKSGKVEASKEPLELLNADLSELRMEEDNIMVNLIGNVHFKQGDLSLRSQRAVWYRTAGQVVFIDSVRIEDSTQTLTADRVTYNRNSGKTIADGNVVLISKKEEAEIAGSHGEYDRQKKIVLMTGSPLLTIKPDKGDSTIKVSAEYLEYYPDERKGIAREKVHITKGDMTATCDTATWLNRENKIVLGGHPKADQVNDHLSGDNMTLFLQNERVNRIEVEGDAKASHVEIDSATKAERESSLGAKNMTFILQNEKLSQVIASDNASSIYYPQTSQKPGKAVTVEKNEASGDTINLFLDNQRINRVLIKGGAVGSYVFPKEKITDSTDVADTVRYSADLIDYTVKEYLIHLTGNSTLQYGQISLSAGKIVYQTEEEIMVAEGIKSQVEGKEVEEGSPILKDGSDELKGERMTYDMRSQRGKVETGVTDIQRGTYRGELLRKIDNNVLLSDRGTYTTCDKIPPHFHFYARRMKIITRDKVIVKPVVMYIEDLPVAAIPFYIFPIKPGRHSGFLTFDFGNLQGGNRFIRNVGYYWAISDYWDLKPALDYYEGSGWLVKAQTRYAKRYVLNGNIAASYNRESSWNLGTLTKTKHDRWDLTFSHYQIISPSLSLTSSGTFMSDKNYWRDINLDAEERRNRSLYSQASISKNWKTSSVTMAVDHRWNLDTDDRTINLPVIRFSRTSLPLFAPKETGTIEAGATGITERKWYNSIYFSLSSNLQNYQNRVQRTGYFDRKKFTTLDNSISVSAPQKFFGWLVLSPSARFQETWYYVYKTNLSEISGIPGNSSARRGTYSTSVSASTALYGTYNPKIGKLVGIRHVMTPGVSFNWQPQFTRKLQYLSYTGAGGSGSKSKSMGFGLNHLVQIKTKSLKDGKEVENKLDLFNLNFSSGYNFLAKQHKLSNLATSLRTYAIKNVDFAFSTSHDLYDQSGKLKLLSPRWLFYSFDTHLSLRGSWKEVMLGTPPEQGIYGAEGQLLNQPEGEDEGVLNQITQSWNVDLTHRYSQNRGSPKTHWISTSLRLPLTKKWLLNYLNRYDFSENKITEQTFELYRDLHCWEGKFTWVASGYRKGYYFRINIKALPEVKVEKGGGGLREVFF